MLPQLKGKKPKPEVASLADKINKNKYVNQSEQAQPSAPSRNHPYETFWSEFNPAIPRTTVDGTHHSGFVSFGDGKTRDILG
jgi:hypothetical protein